MSDLTLLPFVPEKSPHRLLKALDFAGAAIPERFHRTLPGSVATPLRSLDALSARLGLARVWVKDESFRLDLNAFKALGGSWAMAKRIAERLQLAETDITFARLTSSEAAERLGRLTFVTATDGNHGRGVAWSARVLGHRARVYLPAGTAKSRVDNIRAQGAEAVCTDLSYDDAVRLAQDSAREHGWLLVQDTSWPGYEDVPLDIMRGYTTMTRELVQALSAHWVGERPTHVFLQAGVGSFAASMAASLSSLWPDLVIAVVEPDKADCLFRTARADDGRLHAVTETMDSMMAGLCCGVPSMQAWEVLRRTARAFIACSDDVAALGMRVLASPEGEDASIVSGESGAVGCGVLCRLMTDQNLVAERKQLGLNERSRVLLISTEGDTDPVNYARIVHQGAQR